MSRKVLTARFGKKVGAIQQMQNKTEKRGHRKQREAEIGPKVIDPRKEEIEKFVTDRDKQFD
jgi:hypothetical protein